jgi:hypothetical protein
MTHYYCIRESSLYKAHLIERLIKEQCLASK